MFSHRLTRSDRQLLSKYDVTLALLCPAQENSLIYLNIYSLRNIYIVNPKYKYLPEGNPAVRSRAVDDFTVWRDYGVWQCK